MPIMWPCPGHPKCRKIYLYGQGFRAHIASCKHAQSKKVRGRREALETMFSIVCFTESRNLGNITLARRRVPDFRQEPATLCRVWRHCDKRCQRQIHASHLDWIYHRSKHQSEWDRLWYNSRHWRLTCKQKFFTNNLVFKLFIILVLVNINGQRGICTYSYRDYTIIYLQTFKQTLYMFVKVFGDRNYIY